MSEAASAGVTPILVSNRTDLLEAMLVGIKAKLRAGFRENVAKMFGGCRSHGQLACVGSNDDYVGCHD